MNNLQAIRKERGLTTTELAEKVGVGARYIAFIEKGDRSPSLSLAARLAETLDTSIEYLFLPRK